MLENIDKEEIWERIVMVGKEEITIITKETIGDMIDTNKIIDGKEMEIIIEDIITTIAIII